MAESVLSECYIRVRRAQDLLPTCTGSVEREVLGVGSIPVAKLSFCQNLKTFAFDCTNMNIVW